MGDEKNTKGSRPKFTPFPDIPEHPDLVETRKKMGEFDRALPALDRAERRLENALSDSPPGYTPPPVSNLESDYTIMIRGRGPHHNHGGADANRLALKFIRDLREQGHEVVEATFNNGSKEELIPSSQETKKP